MNWLRPDDKRPEQSGISTLWIDAWISKCNTIRVIWSFNTGQVSGPVYRKFNFISMGILNIWKNVFFYHLPRTLTSSIPWFKPKPYQDFYLEDQRWYKISGNYFIFRIRKTMALVKESNRTHRWKRTPVLPNTGRAKPFKRLSWVNPLSVQLSYTAVTTLYLKCLYEPLNKL